MCFTNISISLWFTLVCFSKNDISLEKCFHIDVVKYINLFIILVFFGIYLKNLSESQCQLYSVVLSNFFKVLLFTFRTLSVQACIFVCTGVRGLIFLYFFIWVTKYLSTIYWTCCPPPIWFVVRNKSNFHLYLGKFLTQDWRRFLLWTELCPPKFLCWITQYPPCNCIWG